MKRLNKKIRIKGPHKWYRTNKQPQWDKLGSYNTMICRRCGCKGIHRNYDSIELTKETIKNLSKGVIKNCATDIDLKVPTAIEIIKVETNWPEYKNLTPGSIHTVINPPFPLFNSYRGVYVMGVGEPVEVYRKEFNVFVGTRTKFN